MALSRLTSRVSIEAALAWPLAILLCAAGTAPTYASDQKALQPTVAPGKTQPAWQLAVDKMRGVCRLERFRECMRWDSAQCEQIVTRSIDSGIEAVHPQVGKLSPRLRNMDGVVDGLYVGGMMGALLKASGPRLNNCLPDPRSM